MSRAYREAPPEPRKPWRFGVCATDAILMVFVFVFCAFVGCAPGAKAPAAEQVAAMAISTIGLGVRIADDHCADRARAIFVDEGDKDAAIDLAMKCAGNYRTARSALLSAAYAVDGWADAKNHGRAVCALSEATTALQWTVAALRQSKAWDVPREVSLALAASAVLADMVEARECAMPEKSK
jgi:hypothetical protein